MKRINQYLGINERTAAGWSAKFKRLGEKTTSLFKKTSTSSRIINTPLPLSSVSTPQPTTMRVRVLERIMSGIGRPNGTRDAELLRNGSSHGLNQDTYGQGAVMKEVTIEVSVEDGIDRKVVSTFV